MSTTTTITAPAQPARSFDRSRVSRLVFGSLGVLAALTFVAGALALTWARETHRDGSGYFTTHTHHYQTWSYALSTESLNVGGLTGALEVRLARLKITETRPDAEKPMLLGIGRTNAAEPCAARVGSADMRDILHDA